MFSDVQRKQQLYAEIVILINKLNEQTGLDGPQLVHPSQEEIDQMTVAELSSWKRDLNYTVRSLGGVNSR